VNEKILNEGSQIHNFISSSGSGTVINYGSDFSSSYGSSSGFGSTSQNVTVPTVTVPVPQQWIEGSGTGPGTGSIPLTSGSGSGRPPTLGSGFRFATLPQSTYMYRVPQCMSPRQNWDSPNPSLASECAPHPKIRRPKKKLSTLHTRWLIVTSVPDVWHFGTDIYIRIHYTLNNRFRIRNALKLADSLNIIIQK